MNYVMKKAKRSIGESPKENVKNKELIMIHHCPYCSTSFTANRKDKTYCSNSCKQMAFIKRQEGSVGVVYPNHQNVNKPKRQVSETPNGQIIKPSIDSLPIDIEKLREELYAFAEVAIQNKLDELIQSINLFNQQNVNYSHNETINPELNFFKKDIVTAIELQDSDDENNECDNITYENERIETSIKKQIVKASRSNVDGLDRRVIKTESLMPKSLSNEEETYEPIKCKWIKKLYERFNDRGNDEKFNTLAYTFKDKTTQVEWVSIHYRCLLECVITISEMKAVEWADLAELTNAFTFLISSTQFEELPENYPYLKDVVSLRDQLKGFCLATQDEEWMQFKLKFETKKNLFLQRFELSLSFPKINFNQLLREFEKVSNEHVNKTTETEEKEEWEIRQSPEEKAWRRKFREEK